MMEKWERKDSQEKRLTVTFVCRSLETETDGSSVMKHVFYPIANEYLQ